MERQWTSLPVIHWVMVRLSLRVMAVQPNITQITFRPEWSASMCPYLCHPGATVLAVGKTARSPTARSVGPKRSTSIPVSRRLSLDGRIRLAARWISGFCEIRVNSRNEILIGSQHGGHSACHVGLVGWSALFSETSSFDAPAIATAVCCDSETQKFANPIFRC